MAFPASKPKHFRHYQAYEYKEGEPPPKGPKGAKMSAWLQRQASSHQAQILATALLSGVAVAGVILGAQALRRRTAIDDLKASIPDIDEAHEEEKVPDYRFIPPPTRISQEDEQVARLTRRAQQGDYDEELITEQLTRTSSFLGDDSLSTLRSTFIIVVGLGGVGSHCVSALARSGVGHIRLIDFDQVTLSSLNRHAVATLMDVGTPKVACVRKRLEAVVPWVQWECFNEIWRESHGARLLAGWAGTGRQPDYVVDAIDNIDSKVALLQFCHQRGIKVISAMGAGCKSDPTRVFIGDISTSTEDPLSRVTRRRLRAAGVKEGITVVYSTEKPGPGKAVLLPLPDEQFHRGGVADLSVLPDFRARILPVLGTMPAVFGYVAANYVIMEVSGYPHEASHVKSREKLYENVLQNLQGLEERLAQSAGWDVRGLRIPVSADDVAYLIEEVFRGKSVLSGLSTRLALVRWQAPSEGYEPNVAWAGQKHSRLALADLVCLTKEEALVHEQAVLLARAKPEDMYEASAVELVARRGREERAFAEYR